MLRKYLDFLLGVSRLTSFSISLEPKSACAGVPCLIAGLFPKRVRMAAPIFLILALPSLTVADEIPPELQGEPWRQITAQIESSRHEVRQVDGAWQAHTPAQDYVTEFTDAGPVFRLDDGEDSHDIGLLLDSIDVDGKPVELAAPRVHAEGNKFEYQRGAVTEWYVNNPDGVRQWFRVDKAPAGDTLNVAMRLDSDLTAAMNGDELRLSEDNRTLARFAGLKAWDAQQSPLPASMRVEDGRLVVGVETAGANYPITIDPVMFSEVAKLLPSPAGIGGENSQFGYSVSVDGNRALVGGINLAGSGAALVLVDSGSGWVEEAVLLPSDGEQSDQFGFSVSLFGDRALVGARLDDDKGSNSGSAYVFDFNGSSWSQAIKLTASDGAAGDEFGISVSLAGDRALVGARSDDDNGSDSGSAYLFDFNSLSWSETAKLTASDGAANDGFGTSVSLSGDRALIGANVDDDNGSGSGSAYVFDFNGTIWTETAKLTASDGAANDRFGSSLSLSGDRALVGARFDDDNGSNSGSAYVFDFDGSSWGETVKLTASDGAEFDTFGWSVSLSGDRALIGAFFDDDNGSDSGSAYMFDFDGAAWTETAKLTAGDGAASDQFGFAVSLSGDRALVGANQDDDNGISSGSAYVFDFNGTTWTETTKLTASDGAVSDKFGFTVSLSGDRALVGAFSDDDNGSDSGSAYVLDFDGLNWSQTAKLTASDGAAGDNFGLSVSLSGGRALVGASKDDDNGSDSGSAYVFDFNGTAWSETTKLLPADGATGDEFGVSVSLSGDRALVGASFDDDNGSFSGSAYVFDFNGTTWTETAKLTASDGAASDRFGESVSLSGARVLVGAFSDDDNGSVSGSAYVFDFNGTAWSETTKLLPADGAAFDRFGESVSLSGDRALVGAIFGDGNASDSGSAYVFDFDGTTWKETTKLTASDAAAGDQFGFSVSLTGDRALVGASLDGDNGINSGSAYVFDFIGTAWSETTKLLPADGAAGDQFGYSVSLSGNRALVGAFRDDDNGTDSGSAYIFVDNQPPVAQHDAVASDEDTLLTGDVLTDNGSGPDADPDGDPLTVTEVNGVAADVGVQIALASGALLTVNGDGSFDYDPNGQFESLGSGDSTVDSFDYTISDGQATDSATVTVTINGVDDPPLAMDDTATVNEDGPATAIDVLANDTDIDGGPIAIDSVTQSDNGTVTITGTGLTYQPDPNFCNDGSPTDDFSYTLSPGGSSASVAVTVTCVNDAPVADTGAATTDEDVAVTITLTGSDVDGDALAFSTATGPTDGSLGAIMPINATTAEVTYTPNPNFNGSDSFTFTVNDGALDSAAATVSITISAVDDPPIAIEDTATVNEDDPATVIDVLANDTDIDGGPIAIDIVTQPAGGTAVITGGGSGLTYEPDPDFCNDGSPTDDFSYTLAPGGSTATVAVTVTCVNDTPEADAGAATTDEDIAVTITLTGNDIDGDALTFAIATGPADGSLGSITPINDTSAEVTYTPDGDFNGSDSFTFMVNDGNLDSGAATVDITVDAANDPPEVNDDTATTDEDTPVDSAVLANDSDIDGNLDPATVTVTAGPADGATSVNTTGVITYTPDGDFNGNDAFTYEVCDDGTPTPSECASATVSITIDVVNDAPEADAGSTTTDEETPVTITLTGSDVDGDALTFDIATGPTNGSLSAITPINDTSAEVTYTPDADFNGSDSFTFAVNDGTVDSGAATVEITVDAVNDPPEADAGTATTDEDVPVTITLTGSDIDGDALTFSIATGSTDGSLGTIMPINDTSAEVTYTPNADFNGSDSFMFTVNDGAVDSSEAMVEITVDAVNDPPEADSVTAKTDQDTAVTITLTGSDVDGDALSFAIATSPADGSLGPLTPINDTGAEVTYTPDADFDGADSFTFSVNDGTVDSDEATVEVIVGLFADSFEQN